MVNGDGKFIILILLPLYKVEWNNVSIHIVEEVNIKEIGVIG